VRCADYQYISRSKLPVRTQLVLSAERLDRDVKLTGNGRKGVALTYEITNRFLLHIGKASLGGTGGRGTVFFTFCPDLWKRWGWRPGRKLQSLTGLDRLGWLHTV